MPNKLVGAGFEKSSFIARIKMKKGCHMCGYKDHPSALNFHFKGKEKYISKKIMTFEHFDTIENIKERIKNCVVRCCNCHRIVKCNKNLYQKMGYDVSAN